MCLLDTTYTEQRLNIGLGQIEIGLDRSFDKHRLNFV